LFSHTDVGFCFGKQSREDASAHLGLLVLKPLHSHRLCRLVETRDDSRVHAPCGKQARERKGVLCCVGDSKHVQAKKELRATKREWNGKRTHEPSLLLMSTWPPIFIPHFLRRTHKCVNGSK
jgi:hypothetical protein